MYNRNRKRSRLETMNAILHLALKRCKKTHIMYQANLSHKQLTKYLGILTTKDLLTETVAGYITTKRGVAFIKKFREIEHLMGEGNSKTPPKR